MRSMLRRPADAQALREAPSAASKQDAAAQHFQLGLKFYRAGDYAAARVEFEAALGLSGEADLLHNLSWTAEKQGQIAVAIDYEERFLAVKSSALTTAELDQARGRLVRLRELQSRGPQAAPSDSPPAAAPVTTARRAEPSPRGYRPPVGALALLVGGGSALVAGIACGGAALAISGQLHSGQAFTLREIDTLNTQGQALNGAAIALDVVGGLSVVGGGVWLVLDWKRSRERSAGGLQPGAGMAAALSQ